MKKILCTALAACILLGGVLALPAFAETPAAIPADHEPRVLNELSGNAAFMRNLKAMLTKTATPSASNPPRPRARRTPSVQPRPKVPWRRCSSAPPSTLPKRRSMWTAMRFSS